MTGLELSWLDVFTDRPLGGNPLAVVLDADALDGEAMLALARELGLSETVFVLEDSSRLRIFTPAREIPLAGHPVVGASLELARRGRIPAEGVTVFRTGAGETPVELSGDRATMTQDRPHRGPDLDCATIAALLGLHSGDVVGAPAICSTGVDFAFARLGDRAALRRVEADQEGIAALDEPALGLVAWAEEEPGVLAQRMFAPRLGVPEDPATGVAAGTLGALRVFHGAEPGSLVVRQGEELGRPSTIRVEVGGEPGAPREVRVGGRAALVMEGRLAPGVPA